ncbi:MAG: hypothetical protein IT348_19385 [Candidatus Eisenbacteria bacterium]|nr:hypothetical protein [Candidatus Eisenbacteria bacterium]
MILPLNPQSKCPCGSGKAAIGCCVTERGFRKPPEVTSPPPPVTGIGQPGCYAASTLNCGGGLSREHYLSKALLEYLNMNGDLKVGGMPWLDAGALRPVAPNALAARVLCRRHNEALSRLDSIAVKFFRALGHIEHTRPQKRTCFLRCGHDLERWLLKLLCGVTASMDMIGDASVDSSLPGSWPSILFGTSDFDSMQGLYMCIEKGYSSTKPGGVCIQPITGRGRITGMGCWFDGFEVVLSMYGLRDRRLDGRGFAYRPLEIYELGEDYERSVFFSWDGPADLGTISLTPKRAS